MPTTSQPFDSTYTDSPYLNPSEAANVAADPTTPGQFDYSDIVISPTTLANGEVGYAYAANVTATGGYEPYTWTIQSGTLPSGITFQSISNTAVLTGTPTTRQTTNFTLGITDNLGFGSAQNYNLTINYPVITMTPSTLPHGNMGLPYSQALTANGGIGNYTYALASGNLPAALTLSNTGSITGTVISNTTPINFSVTATDSLGSPGTQAFTIDIDQPAISITPTTLSNATVGIAYNQRLTATGGVGTYTYEVTSGTLPASLQLLAGNITGTVIAPGNSSFTITAFDSFRSPGSQAYTLITEPLTLNITPPTIPNGTCGNYYYQPTSSTNGVAPFTYAVTSGTVPPGLIYNVVSGLLSGNCTTAGTYTFTVQATDSLNNTGNVTYSPTFIPVIRPTTLTNPVENIFYEQTITTYGGAEPYTYTILAGTLPPGLSLVDDTITGTASALGTYDFTIQSVDNNGVTVYKPTELTVIPYVTVTITPDSLTTAKVDSAYSQQFTADGGTAPYTYAVSAGTLPPGLTLSSSGLLSGTPTTEGLYDFTISATDSSEFEFVGTHVYTLPVQLWPVIPERAVRVYVGGTLQTSGLFLANTTSNSNILANVSNFNNLTVGTHLQGPTIAGNTVIANINQANNTITLSNNATGNASRSQISYSLGYAVTSLTPVTVAFDTAPEAGVNVTILVSQGQGWYQPSILDASNGIPLQEQVTPEALFLRGL